MTQFFLNGSLSEVRQAGGDKKGGEFQNVGDKICPPPWWDRVKRFAKIWGDCPPPQTPYPPASKVPAALRWIQAVHYVHNQDEAEFCILKFPSVFHYLSSVNPKQLCAIAQLGCTWEVGTS